MPRSDARPEGWAVRPTSEATVDSRAWYNAPVSEFVGGTPNEILGSLVRNSEFSVDEAQRDAWLTEIDFLQRNLVGITGRVFLEFSIPRMGSRVDAVLLQESVVFVVEFKVNEQDFGRAAIDQVWDYALDLKNFHEASHAACIVPILIATGASDQSSGIELVADQDQVFRPLCVAPESFRPTLDAVRRQVAGNLIDERGWAAAPYRPTPTIIEAARTLFAHHRVKAMRAFDAGRQNLGRTTRRLEEIIADARENNRKSVCFVTGVPGAGKTLVGLNVATLHRLENDTTHAVLLSGNGPLVAVLREALIRDERARRKRAKVKGKRGSESVKQFIQNVHHFRDEALRNSAPPADHVVVFDEAQRAWNLAKTADFMRRRKNRADFKFSEPEFLLRYVDRHQDWAVVVCLVGGGQEIHTGEAGIGAWLEAAQRAFPHWDVHISSNLSDSEYSAADEVRRVTERERVYFDDSLHLAVSMRSFRAEHVSMFVKALLDCERERARDAFSKLTRYPVVVTRDLDAAKQWVRQNSRGSERFGMVASSKAQRLRPHAIDVRVKADPVQWFLNDRSDTRSSYYLEDAATEFQVQGLELDWVCVSWDADLRFVGGSWSYHDFRGSKWQKVHKPENRNYLRNAYRVLLTRARQGMVIFVPPGNAEDHTRPPGYYDATYQYLVDLGVPVLGESP